MQSRSPFLLLAPLSIALAVCTAAPARASAPGPDLGGVRALVFPSADLDKIRALGPEVLPVLARIYEQSTEDERSVVAWVFYSLGWKSADAKRVLMQDVHTSHEALRLQAQWALGRVSNDADVVDALLDNMQNDVNPLFRDKAACALASDQIHLTEEQKVRLYERVIEALRDPKPQVRDIAIKVLEIHTGQSKGFQPGAPLGQRERSIQVWQQWLAEYRSNL